ncbi:BRCT domain-containing protein [Desulfosarcina variabilis]|uniref:BRCT domain-containing protein n=1 Tax=Desulfosarcina variabilis TaxID=2300 RepID=UPI003AFAA98C
MASDIMRIGCKIFLFRRHSGGLEDLPKIRDNQHKFIINNGGKVSGSVTKKVDFLVCGEKVGSKREKALRLGITCISEDDLRIWCNPKAA